MRWRWQKYYRTFVLRKSTFSLKSSNKYKTDNTIKEKEKLNKNYSNKTKPTYNFFFFY